MNASNQDQGHASIMLGFLDVISCGFAAVLVLAVILSIIRSSAPKPPPPGVRYAMFEFSVPLPADAEDSFSYLLMPELSYTDAKKINHPLVFDARSSKVVDPAARDGNPPFTVELAGFNYDPPAIEEPGEKDAPHRQVWMVVFSQLPENVIPNAEVRYSAEKDRFPTINVHRSVRPLPPGENPAKPGAGQPVRFAHPTTFGPPRGR